jgi:hypothetical protein
MQDKTGNGEGKLNEVKQVWKKEEWIEWKPKGMNNIQCTVYNGCTMGELEGKVGRGKGSPGDGCAWSMCTKPSEDKQDTRLPRRHQDSGFFRIPVYIECFQEDPDLGWRNFLGPMHQQVTKIPVSILTC